MKPWHWITAGVVVLALGRLHPLFRNKVDGVDLGGTWFSFCLRFGSVLIANVLLLIALVMSLTQGR